MNIAQMVGFALTCSLLLVLLRQGSVSIALLLSIAASGVMLTAVVGQLPPVLSALETLSVRAGVETLYIGTVLRVIAVAYIVDFGSQLCLDAGEGTMAKNLQLVGKIMILVMAIPIIVAVADVIIGLLEQVSPP